jgi:opacity protein-like surface antigen
MKRFMYFLFLMGILSMPIRGFAAAPTSQADIYASQDMNIEPEKPKQIGVYVAPKFIYGMTMIDGTVTGTIFEYDAKASVGNQSANSFGGAMALGYNFDKQFNVPLRTEIEYAVFSEAETEMKVKSNSLGATGTFKQTVDIDTLFVNAYVDLAFVKDAVAVPYVGAGVGVGFIDANIKEKNNVVDDNTWRDAGSKSHTNFAWNVGGGVGFNCTDNITLDVGYRFVDLGSVNTQTRIIDEDIVRGNADIHQHQFSTGVRFSF